MSTSLGIFGSGLEEKISFAPNELKRLPHDLLQLITLAFSIHHLHLHTFFNMQICKNMLSTVLKRKE